MSTVATDIMDRCREILSDFPGNSTSVALRLVQEADNFALEHVRLYPAVSEDISVVSGTGEYTLNDDTIRIWAATYYYAATSYQPLLATSYDKLDYESPAWRDVQPSQPSQYYDLGTVVGFYPRPSQTTSTYPFVRLYVSRRRVLISSTVMPPQVPNYDVWVYHALRSYARHRYPEKAQEFDGMLSTSLNALVDFSQGRQARLKPSISVPYPRVRNA